MLHTEHLEVALIKEGALYLVYGLEGDGDLGQLQVVAVGRATLVPPTIFLASPRRHRKALGSGGRPGKVGQSFSKEATSYKKAYFKVVLNIVNGWGR